MRKLTESDKQEILKSYRESAETTSTLAEKYDVSNSTISRLLKSTLPEDEYEFLVSLKRAARTPEGRAQVSYDNIPTFNPLPTVPEPIEVEKPSTARKTKLTPVMQTEPLPVVETVNTEDKSDGVRRVRKKRSSVEEQVSLPVRPAPKQLELLETRSSDAPSYIEPQYQDDIPADATAIELEVTQNTFAEMFGEELLDDQGDDLDDLDDLDDEDDEEDYEWEAPRPLVTRRSGDSLVRVLPLSAASLPRTCYLVIDRAAELITRPLRDFGDLGQIPNPETQQRTLPIFDNHRVAKRFSTKRDRVIKVPDSRMLHKARYQLQAKGITRLLIDGQVYSLSSV
ncbi:MAG: transposase [Calothrix sp. C42_A2020_038]|nr:transposase [Calothrix sp. C42_A2020_038]